MNEKAIKELYWELQARAKKLNEKLNKLGVEPTEEFKQLNNLLATLRNKATKASINLDNNAGISVIDNAADDWEQVIESAELDQSLKNSLKKRISTLNIIPTAKQMMDLVLLLDKYYAANISNLEIKNAIAAYEKAHGKYSPEQAEIVIENHRKSAYSALLDGIEGIDSSLNINVENDIHVPFESYVKGALPLKEKAEGTELAYQYKLDITEKEWGSATETDTFKFSKPKIQFSIVFSFQKAPHLAKVDNKSLFGADIVNSYEQLGRTTVSLGNLTDGMQKKWKPSIGSNLLSKGIEINTAVGKILLKAELGSVNWVKLDTDNVEGKKISLLDLSLGGFRFQYEVNALEIAKRMGVKGLTITKAVVKASGGFNVSLKESWYNDFLVKKAEKRAKKLAKKKATEKLLENKLYDEKKLVNLKEFATNLEEEAKDINKIIDKVKKEQKISDSAKKALKKYGEDMDKLVNGASEKLWKTVDGHKAAKEVVKETGEKILKTIGKETVERFLKIGVRAVPFIGTAMTIGETVIAVYDFYCYLEREGLFDSKINFTDRIDMWLRGHKIN